MALNRWPIFSLLDPAFFQQVKQAVVFGSSGNEAIIITKEDEFYSLGSNSNGCLGVGDCNGTLLPLKVPQLCKKGVLVKSSNIQSFAVHYFLYYITFRNL